MTDLREAEERKAFEAWKRNYIDRTVYSITELDVWVAATATARAALSAPAVPPPEVQAAAKEFVSNGYRCPLNQAKLVFDYVASLPAAPPGWQPIETVPKDGLVDILNDGRRYAGCHYDRICDEFRHITACGVLIRLKTATHWMPLPAAPSPQEET